MGLTIVIMTSIEVDALGLLALASLCEEQAFRVSSMTTPSFSGRASQPSAAAVHAVHADVAAATVRLTARMQSTAAAASIAAMAYAGTEATNASDIASVSAAGITAV